MSMQFGHVLGQEDAKGMIRSAFQQDRLAHAFLILGRTGYGGLALALASAQYIMCPNRTESDSCGTCTSCRKVNQLIHPDLHFTFPTVKPKGQKEVTSLLFMNQWRSMVTEHPYFSSFQWVSTISGGDNKQGNITKDECHRILKTLSLKAFESDHKIQIIWKAEYLAREGNRLLKIIEEPPENTHFFLIAEEEGEVLNTIVSRCQILRAQPIDDGVLKSYLMERSDITNNVAGQVVQMSDGDVGYALELAQSEQLLGLKDVLAWLRIVYKGAPLQMADFAEQFNSKGRETQKNFFAFGLTLFREIVKVLGGAKLETILPDQEKVAIHRIAGTLTLEQAQQIVDLLGTSIYHLERYASPKILILEKSIKIAQIFATKQSHTTAVKSTLV